MKKFFNVFLTLAFLSVVLVGLNGCKNKNPQGRKAVQGTIKLDGTPIASGSIEFSPADSNNPQTSAGANIVDGAYTIPETKGLADGTYTVIVSARVDTGETTDTGMGAQPVFKETVPPEYGSESVQTTTVSGKGPFVYDLDIPSK